MTPVLIHPQLAACDQFLKWSIADLDLEFFFALTVYLLYEYSLPCYLLIDAE